MHEIFEKHKNSLPFRGLMMSKGAHFYSIILSRINKRQSSKRNIPTDVLHLSWVLNYNLDFNLSSWGKAYLIDDPSRGDKKQSEYLQIHKRAEIFVEGIVDEFCLVFSSIKA